MSDALEQIRQLYFATTRANIERDFDTAIDLLKAMTTEDERDRAAVYMDGLAQMKAQWTPSRLPRASSSPRAARGPGRSGPSKDAGRRPR